MLPVDLIPFKYRIGVTSAAVSVAAAVPQEHHQMDAPMSLSESCECRGCCNRLAGHCAKPIVVVNHNSFANDNNNNNNTTNLLLPNASTAMIKLIFCLYYARILQRPREPREAKHQKQPGNFPFRSHSILNTSLVCCRRASRRNDRLHSTYSGNGGYQLIIISPVGPSPSAAADRKTTAIGT